MYKIFPSLNRKRNLKHNIWRIVQITVCAIHQNYTRFVSCFICARSILVNVVTGLSGYKHIFHEAALTKAGDRFSRMH